MNTNASTSPVFFRPRFIFLNGPSQSGKTTLATLLQDLNPRLAVVDFPAPLWDIMDILTSYTPDGDSEQNYSHQDVKDSKIPGSQRTVREGLISAGRWVRELLGDSWLGERALKTCLSLEDLFDTFILPNARMPEDLFPFTRHFAPDELLLLRIHRDKLSFEHDIGHYLSNSRMFSADIENNSTPDAMLASALRFISAERNSNGLTLDTSQQLSEDRKPDGDGA